MRNLLAETFSRTGPRAARRVARVMVAFLAMVAIAVQPVAAQSILRDAETEALFTDMVAPLVAVSELMQTSRVV